MSNFHLCCETLINMPSLCNNPDLFMHVRLFIINLGYSAAYFLAKIMPVRYEGTLTQRRMRIGSFTFPDIGSMKGQYVIILSIHINFFFLISVITFFISATCSFLLSMNIC